MYFFFNDTATTEIYTLSLHDALPIFVGDHDDRPGDRAAQDLGVAPLARLLGEQLGVSQPGHDARPAGREDGGAGHQRPGARTDRKSTRLNSSHANISYAVFCLKTKKS